MTPWLKPCMYMWECGMCLDLTFPYCLQVSRDLLFVSIFPPYQKDVLELCPRSFDVFLQVL